MNWIDLKNIIYYEDGSWRDIYVVETNRLDWKKWSDYINKNHIVNWFNAKRQRNEKEIDFKVIEEFWNGNKYISSTAQIFIGKIQINAHFFDETEIENDINPKEFNSLDEHNNLVKYMSKISTLLDKEVILTRENEDQEVLMKVNRGRIEIVTE